MANPPRSVCLTAYHLDSLAGSHDPHHLVPQCRLYLHRSRHDLANAPLASGHPPSRRTRLPPRRTAPQGSPHRRRRRAPGKHATAPPARAPARSCAPLAALPPHFPKPRHSRKALPARATFRISRGGHPHRPTHMSPRRRLHSLGGPWVCASKPIERSSRGVCNRKDEDPIGVLLERNDVGKTMYDATTHRLWPSDDARPNSERPRSRCDPGEGFTDLGHELLAQPDRPLVVPQRRGPEFRTGFRVKNDPHAGARVPSQFAFAPSPSPRVTRGLWPLHVSAAPTRRPKRRRPPPPFPRGWRAPLQQRVHAPAGEGEVPE